MDINSLEYKRSVFETMAPVCEDYVGGMCKEPGYACRDYMCPKVKSAKDLKDLKSKF